MKGVIAVVLIAALAVLSYAKPTRSAVGGRGEAVNGANPLPPGARWVEYLESTGAQWIDSGIIPDNETGYLLLCSPSSVGGNKVPCGQRETTDHTRWYINFASVVEVSWNTYVSVGGYSANTWYEMGFNWLNSRVGTKDSAVVYNISQQLTPRTRTAYVFANNYIGRVANYFPGKIASLKISRGLILVRDFRPIAIGDKGYMLDLVSGEYLPYGNKGTGEFVIGPDKK